MGLISWSDNLVSGDNVTATHITTLKSDITTVVNGNITNTNVNASAAIVESKLSFNTTSGHSHNGTDSRYPLIKHYRRGLQLKLGTTDAIRYLNVMPGVLDVAGALLIKTTTTELDLTTDFLGGESEPADGPVYVYAYNNSGVLGYKLSTSVPEISDSSGNTAEFPLRYHTTGGVYYRLVGIAHNRTDLLPDMFNCFDLSNFACGSFTGDGGDETIVTGWTPDVIWKFVCSDSTPANGETFTFNQLVQRYGFATANPQPQALLYDMINNTHDTSANGTANTFYNINAQTTTQAGSFTIDAATNGVVTMWMAWTHNGGVGA